MNFPMNHERKFNFDTPGPLYSLDHLNILFLFDESAIRTCSFGWVSLTTQVEWNILMGKEAAYVQPTHSSQLSAIKKKLSIMYVFIQGILRMLNSSYCSLIDDSEWARIREFWLLFQTNDRSEGVTIEFVRFCSLFNCCCCCISFCSIDDRLFWSIQVGVT